MKQRFHVPLELQTSWWRLSSLYRDYLPDLKMDRNSFYATESDAAAIFQQLGEMFGLPINMARQLSRRSLQAFRASV